MYIEERGKSLLLRWTHEGKKYSFSLKGYNNPVGKTVAEQKLAIIKTDIQAGYFDPTLLKYKPRKLGSNPTEITAVKLFEKYTAAMAQDKGLSPGSMHRYKAISSKVRKCLGDKLADRVTDTIAKNTVSR
jgi:integrase